MFGNKDNKCYSISKIEECKPTESEWFEMMFAPTNQHLIARGRAHLKYAYCRHLQIWNIEQNKCESKLIPDSPRKEILHISFLNKHSILVYTSENETTIRNFESGNIRYTIPMALYNVVSLSDNMIAGLDFYGSIIICDLTKNNLRRLPIPFIHIRSLMAIGINRFVFSSFLFNSGYTPCLMTDETKLEKGKFYVKEEKDGFAYTVMNTYGRRVDDKITNAELPIPKILNFLETVKLLLESILRITAKRGHTHSPDSSLRDILGTSIGILKWKNHKLSLKKNYFLPDRQVTHLRTIGIGKFISLQIPVRESWCSPNTLFRMWDAASHADPPERDLAHFRIGDCCVVFPDGETIAYSGPETTTSNKNKTYLYLYNLKMNKKLSISFEKEVEQIILSPNGNLILGLKDNSLMTFTLERIKYLRKFNIFAQIDASGGLFKDAVGLVTDYVGSDIIISKMDDETTPDFKRSLQR